MGSERGILRVSAPACDVSAFIVAGGRSTRMGEGKDKAFLDFAGQSLLQRSIAAARAVSSLVALVGPASRLASFGTVVEDIYRGQGPLGGIHAALRHSNTRLNLILAVDMPMLEVSFLEYLVATARKSDALVTVPFVEGRYQPLCAVYASEFAVVAEQSLSAGKNKIDPLFAAIKMRVIDETELSAGSFPSDIFTNVNTSAQFERARERIKSNAL